MKKNREARSRFGEIPFVLLLLRSSSSFRRKCRCSKSAYLIEGVGLLVAWGANAKHANGKGQRRTTIPYLEYQLQLQYHSRP